MACGPCGQPVTNTSTASPAPLPVLVQDTILIDITAPIMVFCLLTAIHKIMVWDRDKK